MSYSECPTPYKCAILRINAIQSPTLYKHSTRVGAGKRRQNVLGKLCKFWPLKEGGEVQRRLLSFADEGFFSQTLFNCLKSESNLPKKIVFICFNYSPSKMMKNAFYFILKALFVLKIFKFLSLPFGHVEKTA